MRLVPDPGLPGPPGGVLTRGLWEGVLGVEEAAREKL